MVIQCLSSSLYMLHAATRITFCKVYYHPSSPQIHVPPIPFSKSSETQTNTRRGHSLLYPCIHPHPTQTGDGNSELLAPRMGYLHKLPVMIGQPCSCCVCVPCPPLQGLHIEITRTNAHHSWIIPLSVQLHRATSQPSSHQISYPPLLPPLLPVENLHFSCPYVW